jgi:GT2 family glycosyltransferase
MQHTVIEQVGGYDERMRHGEDLDWFLRARELHIPAITHCETVLWYRHHADNTWLGKQDTFASDLIAFVKRRLEHKR